MDIHTLPTNTMNLIKNLGNWALLIAVSAACIVAVGAWMRLMVKLFCIGYGC